MATPVEIADALARAPDRFGLVLAAAEHARALGNTEAAGRARPSGARCAAALGEVVRDDGLRSAAWERLVAHFRRTGERDDPSDDCRVDEERLIALCSHEAQGGQPGSPSASS